MTSESADNTRGYVADPLLPPAPAAPQVTPHHQPPPTSPSPRQEYGASKQGTSPATPTSGGNTDKHGQQHAGQSANNKDQAQAGHQHHHSNRSRTCGRRPSEELALSKKGYILGEKIGEGSYAEVCLAEFHKVDKVQVLACKIVDRAKCPKEFVKKFFPRELDIIKSLDHPNIVRIHSILERHQRIYIFMQYAENGNLLDHVKRTLGLSEPQSHVWFKQLVGGLMYLHQREIAHRDLKCENILITGKWNIKIGDFGFSRRCVTEEGKRCLSQTYCGSVAYGAPEVIRGEPYNPKMSDVWSLGVILYIMLNGSMPFDDTKVRKLLKDQEKRNWSFRSRVKDKLTNQVKSLVVRMLEPDLTKRSPLWQVANDPWLSTEMEKILWANTPVLRTANGPAALNSSNAVTPAAAAGAGTASAAEQHRQQHLVSGQHVQQQHQQVVPVDASPALAAVVPVTAGEVTATTAVGVDGGPAAGVSLPATAFEHHDIRHTGAVAAAANTAGLGFNEAGV